MDDDLLPPQLAEGDGETDNESEDTPEEDDDDFVYEEEPRPWWRQLLVLAIAVVAFFGGSYVTRHLFADRDTVSPAAYAKGKKGLDFYAADGDYTLRFPREPVRKEQQVPAGTTSLRLVQYTAQATADVGFSSGWFLLPQAPAPEGVGQFLDATVNGSVAAIKGKLLDSHHLTVLGQYPAAEYTSTAPEDHFVKARVIVVGANVYVLQVVSNKREPVGYGRFVDSFSLGRPKKP